MEFRQYRQLTNSPLIANCYVRVNERIVNLFSVLQFNSSLALSLASVDQIWKTLANIRTVDVTCTDIDRKGVDSTERVKET